MRPSPALLALALAAPLCACGGGGGDDTPAADAAGEDFDRQALLSHIGRDIVLPTYESFAQASAALATEVEAACAALGTADEDGARAAAQEAWRASMDAWQLAEMMVFGPAAMDGRALRDQIYSWNVVSTCAVDQAVAQRHADPEAFDVGVQLTNRRGLPALEYLLWADSLDHSCPSQSAPAGWNELDEATRKQARCDYAAAAAADLVASANVLVNAWSPEGGNFVAELESAGDGSAVYESQQAALNAITDALFYIDTDVKGMKLAEPAGLTDNRCGTIQEPCLAELESPHAGHSLRNVEQNLVAFHWVFTGAREGEDGLGYDDLLTAVGAGELATTMTAEIEASLAAVRALEGTLAEALASDYDAVVATYDAIQALDTNFKSQFLTVLGLDRPNDVSDND